EDHWRERDGDSWKERSSLCATRATYVARAHRRDEDERMGKEWANGDGGRFGGGNADEGVCESGVRMVVEERGSVVERPSRCGHELRRSGNVGSV
ncbi:hypothetical protein X777_12930, partial [Ooceraea biroi]